MKFSREATKTVTVSQDWCQSDLVTRTSEFSSVSQMHINWNFPHSQPFKYSTGHYSCKKVFYGLVSLSVGGKKQRCPTSKKRIQCELREHQEVVPQVPLQSPGEHSSRVARNIFSIPKGNYLRFPVFSFVWHVFLLFYIFKNFILHEITPKSNLSHYITFCYLYVSSTFWELKLLWFGESVEGIWYN